MSVDRIAVFREVAVEARRRLIEATEAINDDSKPHSERVDYVLTGQRAAYNAIAEWCEEQAQDEAKD